MKRSPMQPVVPAVPIYKPVVGLLVVLIALAASVAATACLGTAVLRLLEIRSIADRLLPAWPWWKLTGVTVVSSYIVSHVCGYVYKWAND